MAIKGKKLECNETITKKYLDLRFKLIIQALHSFTKIKTYGLKLLTLFIESKFSLPFYDFYYYFFTY